MPATGLTGSLTGTLSKFKTLTKLAPLYCEVNATAREGRFGKNCWQGLVRQHKKTSTTCGKNTRAAILFKIQLTKMPPCRPDEGRTCGALVFLRKIARTVA